MPERNAATEEALADPDNNFIRWRQLDDGTYVALGRLAFTVGLFIGVQPGTPYKRRYCFDNAALAFEAYYDLQTGDDVPTGWIARRPETAEDVRAKSEPDYDPSQFWPKKEGE